MVSYLQERKLCLPYSDEESPSKITDKRLPLGQNRPVSAKGTSFLNSKTPKRPRTKSKGSKKFKRPQRNPSENTFLGKNKARRVPADRFHEENMVLKLQNATLKEELLRCKTRLSHLERVEDSKFSLKAPNQVVALKQTIKSLRLDLQSKEEELSKLKKSAKVTTCNELEIEIQAYIDECTRLRHHLEEVMRQRETKDGPHTYTSLEEKQAQQTELVQTLKKENQELSQLLKQAKEETNRWRERYVDLDKKTRRKSGSGELKEIKNLHDTKTKEGTPTLQQLHNLVQSQQKSVSRLLNHAPAVTLT